MKSIKYYLLSLASILLISSCSTTKPEEETPVTPPEEKPVVVEKNYTANFSSSVVELAMDEDHLNAMMSINKDVYVSGIKLSANEDGKGASYSIDVPQSLIAPYEFRFVSPASAVVKYNKDLLAWNIEFPSTQTPGTNAVDPKAVILAAWTEAIEEIPTEKIELNFQHISAYGKLTISNLAESAGAISKIALVFEKNISGRFLFDDGTYTGKLPSTAITLNATSVENVLFGSAPADLAGTTIAVEISAEGGEYTKTFTLADEKLEAGKTTEFNFDFKGVPSSNDKVYSLVTSASQLSDNDEVIIVCTEAKKAISTTQNAKNRGAADITIEEDGTVKNPSSNVQTLGVKLGSDNTIAFSLGEKYLGPQEVTDNCYLVEIENLEDAYLSLVIEENGNTAMTRTSYTLKYYGKNNVFNMFLPSTGKAVQIYKRL